MTCILQEVDYPPTANAGDDIVVNLPVNYVTLYGNTSTDDKGIHSYEWKATDTDSTTDLEVSLFFVCRFYGYEKLVLHLASYTIVKYKLYPPSYHHITIRLHYIMVRIYYYIMVLLYIQYIITLWWS